MRAGGILLSRRGGGIVGKELGMGMACKFCLIVWGVVFLEEEFEEVFSSCFGISPPQVFPLGGGRGCVGCLVGVCLLG